MRVSPIVRWSVFALALGACSSSKSKTAPDAKSADAPAADAPPMTSCDGVQASDSSGNKVDILTYPFDTALASCDPASMTSLTNLIGIVDEFSEKMGTVVEVVTPTNCTDVMGTDNQGGSNGTTWNGMCPASMPGCPASFTTINSLKASWPATATSETLVGVVEAVRAGSQGGGDFYFEDGGSCTTNCGLEVYVPKTITTALPTVGALVTTTGMTGVYNGAKQITAASFAVIGATSYKLLPVTSLTPPMVSPMAMTTAGPYEGMRVQVTGMLTTSSTCPPELTFTSTGG